MNVVFLGTPDICIPVLELLRDNQSVNLVHIISMPDRPSGRGKKLHSPEVIQFAKNNSIPFFQTSNLNKENEFIENLEKQKIDFFIVFAFAQFLGSRLISLPSKGAFNIHTSILPKYRGAAPIQYALLNGDKKTGVSIQKMVKKMDAGDVAVIKEVSIDDNDNQTTLTEKLRSQAPEALQEFILKLQNNNLILTPQNESDVSFAPSFTKADGKIDFTNNNASDIRNKVRGLVPWPGCYFDSSKDRIKVLNAELSDFTAPTGKIKIIEQQLIVGTKNGSIRLSKIQLAGKKPCFDKDFIQGFKGELIINEH
jgi:methionyl-tRNA formyltransferase